MQRLHLHKSVIGQAVPQEAPQHCCADVLFCCFFRLLLLPSNTEFCLVSCRGRILPEAEDIPLRHVE